MRIGVTGHQDLANEEWVKGMITGELSKLPTGTKVLSSLAIGTDQLFAEIALNLSLLLIAVIPCRGYENTFKKAGDLKAYQTLLRSAEEHVDLDWPEPSEEAFYGAGKYIAEHCDTILAIWNEKPAQGLGGTGDIVAYAKKLDKQVKIYNPELMTNP